MVVNAATGQLLAEPQTDFGLGLFSRLHPRWLLLAPLPEQGPRADEAAEPEPDER